VADIDKSVRELITPEGIDLKLRIGDAAERAGAFLIDMSILVGVAIVFAIAASAAYYVTKSELGREAIGIVLILFFFFFFRSAYFIAFELGPRAATPGKMALGLRVAARNGGRLTADMVFARNFMRELEFFMPFTLILVAIFTKNEGVDGWMKLAGFAWCAVFVFFPLFNRDRLRVGDLIAGTWVVKAPKRTLMPDLAGDGEIRLSDFAFTHDQLDAYGVYELQVLEDVLRRRDRKTMASVADRIRMKIGWVRIDNENDGDFLSAYYAGLRGRLESRLLFGKRKKDKHDKT
jgi:uncharacterized RDD family membrane protein YckC